ncbi:MAG: methionyl-tRNA formyltransferase [Desulfobacterota bacterium]|nr:methionyl-tRNA formyltransferase [Thermodesulfobacteriota bacterium]MDW8002254.1 methionyl-tRNA formyltransferase [Deltaproteobacteria bacterium]
MKICFFGSSVFSVPSLVALKDRVVLVVTKKAKPKGRGYGLDDNEVKKCAKSLNLGVLEISSFTEPDLETIRKIEPDLFVVVSFGLILPESVLKIPKIGAINVHPSLLPKYRGPSPIQAALLNGDKETGITIIRMSKRMDAGNVLLQKSFEIREDDDSISLSERLSREAADILFGFVNEVEKKGLEEGIAQDEKLATYTKMIKKEMARIDWNQDATQIVNAVRAYAGWPVSHTYLDGKLLKIHKARVYDLFTSEKPGKILFFNKNGIVCACGSGSVLLTEVQQESRRRMSAHDFAIGAKDIVGKIFT